MRGGGRERASISRFVYKQYLTLSASSVLHLLYGKIVKICYSAMYNYSLPIPYSVAVLLIEDCGTGRHQYNVASSRLRSAVSAALLQAYGAGDDSITTQNEHEIVAVCESVVVTDLVGGERRGLGIS